MGTVKVNSRIGRGGRQSLMDQRQIARCGSYFFASIAAMISLARSAIGF